MLGRWVLRLFSLFVFGIVLLLGIAAALPVEADPTLPPEEFGAGASSVEPSYSGLLREFPAVKGLEDNPSNPEKAELGRLLFFDPVLSVNNDMSCATCHHPDYGFTDGLPKGIGAGGEGHGAERTGGVEVARNVPMLWNVAYNSSFFWDGRAETLEGQSVVPLTHVDEMANDPEALAQKLRDIPAYTDLFQKAFNGGEEAVSFENVSRALAAFQRTLISNQSPFDRYAEGQVEALTPQQRRGLTLFRSGATRCFECHMAPTFTNNTFRVIGVPDEDPGRAAVANDAPEGAFRVPSLRNVALTAPYMHNGSLASLEAVIDFYADGAGRAHGKENLDPFINPIDLNAQEKADLVAYLYALTDESQRPETPTSVPSGFPVVTALENPARAIVAEQNRPLTTSGEPEAHEPRTIRVQEGESIQAAVDRARPGDKIEIPYGTYNESVALDTSDITLHGIPNENGDWPILDGRNEFSDGVIASGNNFTIGYLQIRNYNDNAVLVEGVRNVHFHDLITEKTGTYGVYPVHSTDVLIERITASGVNDAAIYAGQCENVIVRDSEVFDSVIGIELENTVNGEIYNNHAHDNSLGIFVVLLPQLTSKVSMNTKVYDNISENNNIENFADPDMTAAIVPPGVGILVLASDNNEVYNNTFRNNKSSGTALFNLSAAFDENEIDVAHNPENNHFYNNIYENNGYAPDTFVASLDIPTGDILWDGSGFGNHFDEPEARGGFPPALPQSSWPVALQRAYWHSLNFVIGLLG